MFIKQFKYAAANFLITGDTLFNGTIGNCFTGDFNAPEMIDTLKTRNMPVDTEFDRFQSIMGIY